MRKVLKNKAVLKDCKIYRMLTQNNKRRHFSFHTPGHKNAKWDITELSYSDNLSAPKGCLAEAERDIATILGAKKSFILTDGSTSGVLSMLFAAKALGVKKILASVDTHKSFFNGCAALGLIPLLYAVKNHGTIPALLTLAKIKEECFALLEEADALFITSPSYYGRIADLAALREYCNQTGKLLLIDGAHGGHLHFNKDIYAGAYADIWVDGVHKSLPAFTQGAVVSASSEQTATALKSAVDIFRTTSPSYPIMASVEYAVKYPQNIALEKSVRDFAAENQDRIYLQEDWTKLCAIFGDKAFAVEADLEKQGIYPEFCDGNCIMFYFSPATPKRDFLALKKRLEVLFSQYPLSVKEEQKNENKELQLVPAPLVFDKREVEWVSFDEAEGRVCARLCGLFPPCTPLLLVGEKISRERIELFKQANNVFGVENASILVYKK